MGLSKVSQDLRRSDNVVGGGDCQSGGTVQARIQLVKTQFLSCKADQSVLDDSILNASFTELLAELGIILYVDALVVDQYTCRRILDLLYQGSDQSLLLFQNLLRSASFSPPVK